MAATEEADVPESDLQDLQEIIDDNSSLKDVHEGFYQDIEDILGQAYEVMEMNDSLSGGIPFGANIQTASNEYNMVYNDLNQVVSYDITSTQYGNGKNEAYNAFYSCSLLLINITNFNDILTNVLTRIYQNLEALYGYESEYNFSILGQNYNEKLTKIVSLSAVSKAKAAELFEAIKTK